MSKVIQEVEGFDHIISGKTINDSDWRDASYDFRGLTQAWTSELWFEKGRSKYRQQELVWETAACPEKTKTVFSFIGKSAFLPYEYAFGNQAKIFVNDADALTFHLGLRRSQQWKEGEFELEFIPKRVQTPFEGYLREFELPGYGEIGPLGEEQGTVAIFKSDDEGMSWEHFSTVASDQDIYGEGHFSCGETSIRLTKSGKIVAIMRTELRPGEQSPVEGLHMWQSVSDDSGETWTKPKRLHDMLSTTQPNLIQLNDGRLLVGYGYRGIDYGQWGDQPFGIRFHVSEDEGETWSPQIILRDDFPNVCMGYPASVEIEENRIFTVYWFNLFGRYYLEGSFWTIPDEIDS